MAGLNILLIASIFLGTVAIALRPKLSTCTNELCTNNGECKLTSDKSYKCLCRSGYTGTNCQTMTRTTKALQNRNLTITVKSTLYDLYIDGTKRNSTYGTNWTHPDTIPLGPLNRLIGAMAIDSTETCAGLIASATGDYLVTDDVNWRCGYIPDPQWYQFEWDDSVWDPAYIVGPNHNVTWPEECEILTGIPTISPNAYWIWTNTIPETPAYHQTVYCRGYLPLCERDSPCLNGGSCNRNNETLCSCLLGFIGEFCETVDKKDVTITAKDELYAAYVDGVYQSFLPNGDVWQQTDFLLINSTSRLIAVMAIQLEGTCPGILASVTDSRGDYVLTNITWKCQSSAMVGWSELGYDDSGWPNAMIIHKNENINDTACYDDFIQISSISPNAYWIWTNTSVKQDVAVYCRGYLPICDAHPCKNGGTCNVNRDDLCTCLSNFTGQYCEYEILENATLSSDDASRVQNLGATADAAPIPAPNPVPPHSAGKDNDPSLPHPALHHAPIEKSHGKDDTAPIPAPNPVPPHSAGKDNDPSLPHPALHHAPIEKSDGTESRNNVRQAIRKQHIG